jgi:hypothetical protein
MAKFEVLPGNLHGVTEEYHEKSLDSWHPKLDLNQTPSKYKFEVLALEQTGFVTNPKMEDNIS